MSSDADPSTPDPETVEKDWLELPRALKSPIYDYVGFDIVDGGEGWAEVELRIDDVLLNADGVLHGGVWTLVADTAMGAAARTLIEPHERVITTQMDFRWMRPISGRTLRCVGRVMRRGRTGWHCTVDCLDAEGTLVGMGSGSFVVIDRGRDGAR
ncbi:MAG: PaaI family thioesterase [Dehalococcoidia bacterium]|nr:PaaI family thioesterase [Dehalococcoidia bacterium]MCB9491506.1 PaaI family thioesterase [Dehalococcoidia bacterium]